MKIIILTLFSIISFIQCKEAPSEDEIFFSALKLIEEKKFDSAEKELVRLIDEYSKSKQIHVYYLTLDEMLIKEISSLEDSLNNDKPNKNTGRGTVTIYFGQEAIPAIENIYKRRIKYLENYIKTFQSGIFRERFLSELLFLYTKSEKEKFKFVAKELSCSKNIDNRKNGYFFLALMYHSEEKYKDAIKYYKQMQNLTNDQFERAKTALYISNCFYNIGEYEKALESLNNVHEFEKSLNEKMISRMADIWKKYYLNALKKIGKNTKKQLMYFE